jgi:hypothetical protein
MKRKTPLSGMKVYHIAENHKLKFLLTIHLHKKIIFQEEDASIIS